MTARILAYAVAIFICSPLTTQTIGLRLPSDKTVQTKERFLLRLKAGLTEHAHQTTFVAFSPNGQFLITAGDRERTSKLWNTTTNQLIAELEGTTDLEAFRLEDRQLSGVFSSDGRMLVTVRGREAKLWDAETGKLKVTFTGHERDICSVAFSPDGQRLATSGEDGKVKVWNSVTGRLLRTLEVWHVKKLPRWRIVSRAFDIPVTIHLFFSPDGRKMLTTIDWAVSPAKLWDVESGQLIATLPGQTESSGILFGSRSAPAAIHKAMFSADGKLIATQSLNETRIWDAGTGSLKQTFSSHWYSAKISPDGKLIGALKKAESIGLFDIETGDLRIPLSEAQLFADQVVFSSDGRTVAMNGTIIDVPGKRVTATIPFVYKLGRFILEFENYVTDIDYLSFHPNGKVLMAANRHFIRFWDVATGQLITQKTEARIPAAFSPDGRLLATTAQDKKTVLLWQVNLQ